MPTGIVKDDRENITSLETGTCETGAAYSILSQLILKLVMQ